MPTTKRKAAGSADSEDPELDIHDRRTAMTALKQFHCPCKSCRKVFYSMRYGEIPSRASSPAGSSPAGSSPAVMSDACPTMIRKKIHAEEVRVLLGRSYTMATLLVGPDEKQIICHKVLLGFYSGFFEGALFGGFAQAASGVIRLPEDDPAEMQAFVSWLYTGTVDETGAKGISGCKLWVLGDKLLSPAFSNTAMTLFLGQSMYVQDTFREGIDPKLALYAYDKSMEGSKLRLAMRDVVRLAGRGQLVVDQILHNASHANAPERYPWELDMTLTEEMYYEKDPYKDPEEWRLGFLENDAPAPPINPAKRVCR